VPTIVTNEPEHCPICRRPFARSYTCGECGLWWTNRNAEAGFEPYEDPVAAPNLVLHLRQTVEPVGQVILLGIAAFGWWALWLTLNSVLAFPRSGYSWVGFLVALPVGGLVAVTCTTMLASAGLHFLVPSRLNCNADGMHVRVWATWSGLWANFRRRRIFIPRHQLNGVTFNIGQGGGHQLFIKHASGWSFGTGWDGTKGAYSKYAISIVSWLKATAKPSPSRDSMS
jgi:hypothetical protein